MPYISDGIIHFLCTCSFDDSILLLCRDVFDDFVICFVIDFLAIVSFTAVVFMLLGPTI